MQSQSTPKRRPSGAQRRKIRDARRVPTPEQAASEKLRNLHRARHLYEKRRALMNDLKLKAGCADCGFNAHPEALHFDHLPGTKKLFNVAAIIAKGNTAVLLAEIAKCEVVCANCHAIRTAERREKQPLPPRPVAEATNKLTEQDVRDIRSRRNQGELIKTIATTFDITTRTVSSILHGQTWRNVT